MGEKKWELPIPYINAYGEDGDTNAMLNDDFQVRAWEDILRVFCIYGNFKKSEGYMAPLQNVINLTIPAFRLMCLRNYQWDTIQMSIAMTMLHFLCSKSDNIHVSLDLWTDSDGTDNVTILDKKIKVFYILQNTRKHYILYRFDKDSQTITMSESMELKEIQFHTDTAQSIMKKIGWEYNSIVSRNLTRKRKHEAKDTASTRFLLEREAGKRKCKNFTESNHCGPYAWVVGLELVCKDLGMETPAWKLEDLDEDEVGIRVSGAIRLGIAMLSYDVVVDKPENENEWNEYNSKMEKIGKDRTLLKEMSGTQWLSECADLTNFKKIIHRV